MGKILLSICIVLAALGQLGIKYGVGMIAPSTSGVFFYVKVLQNPFVLLGTFCYLVSALLWLKVLSLLPLSIAYPSIAGAYILVVLFSRLIFSEPLTIWKVAGVLLIFLGVTLLGKSP